MSRPIFAPSDWRARGRAVDVPEGKVFAVDLADAPADETPVLVLHGFPTSSWDFAEVASILERMGRRTVLFDFLGFGYSDKPHDCGYSLFEQADVATIVAREMKLSRVHIWAHDMGTSVATELLARRERGLLPFEIASVCLMNGSVHVRMASPTIGQKLLKSPVGPLFARVSRRPIFVAQMKRIFEKQPSEEVLGHMWDLLERADGALRLPQIIQYMEERIRFERRWIGALERIDRPVLVAWGAKDPVARIEIAERLVKETPGADFTTWDDLGHYPQVEDPERVAATVGAFFTRIDG